MKSLPSLRATVVCSMRNEGPFIVEWVSWYRMLGFTDIVVITNDCTDHSPALLDALQAAGWLHHVRKDIPPGEKITGQKLAVAHGHPAVLAADWVMVCDVDEFLVIHRGQGLLADLLAPHLAPDGTPGFLGMSVNWRVFGSDGQDAFVDQPVHRQFFRACGAEHRLSCSVKSIHRRPDWFAALGEHGPRGLSLDRVGQVWGGPGLVWITPDGSPVPEWHPDGDYLRTLPRRLVSHAVAQINHYIVRSAETFSLKAGTLSPVARKDRYRPHYFAEANEGQEQDDSALRYRAGFDRVHAMAMALPDIARLHALCCDDHRRMIAEKAALQAG
jgi:hypothetical protein